MSVTPQDPRAIRGPDESPPWVVVPAGGEGTRLQEFIRHALRSDCPKQFCRITGSRSMLRHTWDRARLLVPPERIVTVITAGQERHLEGERPRRIPGTLLIQPANRETGPGLLLPLLWISGRDPGATVVIFPADHFIWEEARFVAAVRRSVAAAGRLDRLILLGVEAGGPETDYGWIRPAAPVAADPPAELCAVEGFVEKPDPKTAAALHREGCLWNTFVLAGRLQTYLRLAESGMPEVLAALREVAPRLDPRATPAGLRGAYHAIRPTNFSKTLLARHPRELLVLAVRGIYWSDWGEPERVIQTLARFDRFPPWLPRYARLRTAPPAPFEAAG
jgi:mannose-1-phosphate guanylyltransferase